MKFYADWRTYTSRYFSGVVCIMAILLFMFLRPVSAGKSFMFLEMFNGMFLRDIRLTIIFLGIIVFCQMIGYFEVNKNIRFLQINDNFLTIDLFKGQKIELSYVDIVSVQITKDLYLGEVFEFFLKTGNKYKIRSQIKNKHQALELIQKRLINK